MDADATRQKASAEEKTGQPPVGQACVVRGWVWVGGPGGNQGKAVHGGAWRQGRARAVGGRSRWIEPRAWKKVDAEVITEELRVEEVDKRGLELGQIEAESERVGGRHVHGRK